MPLCYRKSFIYLIFFFLVLANVLQLQKAFSQNDVSFNGTNNIMFPSYMDCYIDYKTSRCDSCPPSCLSLNSSDAIIKNEKLAINMDKVFEKSLRQISIINSGVGKNDTKIGIIYLQSLFLKKQINDSELKLIYDVIKDAQNMKSIVTLGEIMRENLRQLTNNSTNSPTAISILKIASKSVDLLINSDSIVTDIGEYPNLPHNLSEQKKWITKILANTIVGCEVSGLSGCLASSISSSGIL